MIRKNSLLCKLNRIKTSSKSLFDTYMQHFQPHLETCPICGSTGNCHIHDYYGRSIVDLRSGKKSKEELCILRVFCESCGHAHAVLPDFIIPYSSYSLFFILYVLGQYFAGLPPLSRSASVPASLENSFSSGLLSGNPINRSGWASWPIPKPPTRHSGSPFRKKKTIPFSHQTSHGSLPIPFSSPMPIQFFHHLQAHGTARRFLLLTFPSSDHTAEGWRPSALSFMMNKNITRRSFP